MTGGVQPPAPGHYPGPMSAFVLTLAALFATALVVITFGQQIDVASLGIGQAVGFGAVATIAARLVPAPQSERLGLRGFQLRLIPALMALVPAVLLVSEVDNWMAEWFPPVDAEQISKLLEERLASRTLVAVIQGAIVTVGIAPVVEEWLFRGVLQQGLIAHLGRVGGLVFTSLLFALGHAMPGVAVSSGLSMLVTSALLGMVLGVARIASQSLLAPILLHAAFNGIGYAALELSENMPIPGFSTQGGHTPAELLFPAALVVGLGLSVLWRESQSVPPTLPLKPEPGKEE